MKLTYKEAYNKIIDAYFKDELKVMESEFCFCGNISPTSEWSIKDTFQEIEYPYTHEEYQKMETALFFGMYESFGSRGGILISNMQEKDANKYEEALFKGMEVALEVLKNIHIERGENIEEEHSFTKREKQCV